MKVCPYCAEELEDDAVLCTQCGRDTAVEPGWRRVEPPGRAPSPEEIVRSSSRGEPSPAGAFGRRGMNRLAIGSFVVVMGVGILATAATPPAGAAVVAFGVSLGLGLKAMLDTRSKGTGGSGFALAAVVLSAVGLLGYGRQLIG